MVNNLMFGTDDDYPCTCVHDNVANGSFSKVTPNLKYADLITCGKCNFKFYSNKEGIDQGPCPKCEGGPTMADSNLLRLAQASTEEKVKQLRRVLNAPFEVDVNMPNGRIVDRPTKRK
jgi:hypothetical protein